MGVTIREIAQAAGVCRATVDKVLHDRPGVSEETRAHVRAVMKELEYQPNLIGQALKRQKNKLHIAAILLELDSLPYLTEGIREACRETQAFGLEVRVETTRYPDVAQQQAQLRALSEQDSAGVILTPLDDVRIAEEIARLRERGIPVITINSDLPNSDRTCFIGQNMIQAGRTAAQLTRMLLGGSGKIAALTSSDLSYFNRGRMKGFEQYLAQHPGLTLVETADTQERPDIMREQTKRLLSKYPDLEALYITCGCVEEAVRVVSDMRPSVRMVCFDSFPENAALMRQGKIDCLIDQELNRQGERAVQLLFGQLVKGQIIEQGEEYMPIRIHIKENLDY